MLLSFLMGLVGGQRAMTPLATVSVAAALGRLRCGRSASSIVANPLVTAATVGLALAEMAADKLKAAPDRTAALGLGARFVTSALAGAALAPARERWLGATLGGSAAVAASYGGWRARTASISHLGRTTSGMVEDAIVITGAAAIVLALSTPVMAPARPRP